MAQTAEIISFLNQKGGTGKTTSCLSIAGFLAKKSKVLIVDLDPQANSTRGLGVSNADFEDSIYDALLGQSEEYDGLSIKEVIVKTDIANLDLAPSELDLTVIEILLHQNPDKLTVLDSMLQQIIKDYDFILIDLPPHVGVVMMNVLYASDHVIIPVDSSTYSLESIENFEKYRLEIEQQSGRSIDKLTVILTKVTAPGMWARWLGKSTPSQQVERILRQRHNGFFTVPECDEVFFSQKAAKPISHFSPESEIGHAYKTIADYVYQKSAA